MSYPRPANPSATDLLALRLEELRAALRRRDPRLLALHTGTTYLPGEPGSGQFLLELCGQPVRLTFPELVGWEAEGQSELAAVYQGLLLYYFFTADGTPEAGEWISFAELPDGRFYQQAFQGYTGRELARAFGDDPHSFAQVAQKLGGEWRELGQMAYEFHWLPRVSLLVVLWQGDEDFPTSCQVLYDRSAAHYLPTDACALLGSLLTRRLIKDISEN